MALPVKAPCSHSCAHDRTRANDVDHKSGRRV